MPTISITQAGASVGMLVDVTLSQHLQLSLKVRCSASGVGRTAAAGYSEDLA
jgi:hypothetical protein